MKFHVTLMTIDYQLEFKIHISEICKKKIEKASRQLNVLKRIGKHHKLGRLTIYHSYIMSNFNYCPVVWLFVGRVTLKK